MHFTTIYILKGEKLDNVSVSSIEEDFGERFCYCCGETKPKYLYWCDWFQIGGRWNEPLVAKKGLVGDRSCFTKDEKQLKNHYAIVEIKDLTQPIDKDMVFAIATKSRIYQDSETWQTGGKVDKSKFQKLLEGINNKTINGVIAFIDCHD